MLGRRMSTSPPTILADRKLVGAFLVLFAANLFVGNATTALWDQDEAAYAGFGRDMLLAHHWVVPEFPYSQPHRKPPLFFWLIAGSYAAFGVNEFALRLPSALGLLVTCAAVWRGGRFLLGADAAKLAAMILASALFVLNLGKIALTDSVLLAFQTIAALALLRGVVRPSWKETVVLWAAVAAGVLTKGPPIVILVGGMFLFLLVFHRRRRNLVHLHPWIGLPLALVPLAIWLALAWQVDQRYVLFMGYWYILRRVGSTTYGQYGPPGVHFLLFFVCLIPWTGYLLTALADAWRQLRRRRLAFVLLGAWLFGGWLLWELPWSKLPTYALAAYPALALLIARQLRRAARGDVTWATHPSLRAGFRILAGTCVVLGIGLLGAGLWFGTPWAKMLAIVPAAAIAATGLLAVRFQRRNQLSAVVPTLLLGGLGANLLVWLVLMPGVTFQFAGTKRVAAAIAARCVPETTVVAVRRAAAPSLPFYVETAGLQFREAAPRGHARERIEVDWSPLWRLRFQELVRQVKQQFPKDVPEEESGRLRLERVRELSRSGAPYAFVLDEEQYAALRGDLADATVVRIAGWQVDHLQETTYVLAFTPTAVKTPQLVIP